MIFAVLEPWLSPLRWVLKWYFFYIFLFYHHLHSPSSSSYVDSPSSSLLFYQCKKNCQFKTWCKGDKSNIENSTDHFCEDNRQNALATLTNLGHVTLFLQLGPSHHLTIEWARETTSMDSKLPDQTEVHIRTDLSSDPLAERNLSDSSRSLLAQWRSWRCCWKTCEYDNSFLKTGTVYLRKQLFNFCQNPQPEVVFTGVYLALL